MTARTTFGELLQTARWHLYRAGDSGVGAITDRDVYDVSRSLGRVIRLMARYAQDATGGYGDLPTYHQPVLTNWARAGTGAREALLRARTCLPYHGYDRWPTASAGSDLGRCLDAVAVALAAGRDLLQTHFRLDTAGTRQPSSDWAMVIISPRATRALLAEIASIAGQVARPCADLALSPGPGAQDTADARRRLNTSCQWLWVMHAAVQEAQQREPVSLSSTELLYQIPVNRAPSRRRPEGGESVTVLCEGTVTAAERLRHLAWGAAERATWSPGMNWTSLHQLAAANTVTSHNCEVLLRTLAARTARPGIGVDSAQLYVAETEATKACASWLRVAKAVNQIQTDTRGQLSQAAVGARDLALWTGRLAHTGTEWTLASGPRYPVRPPEDLAPDPEHVSLAVAAVHHASETLTRLARAEHEQIRAAARAGRIYVTTRSLPDGFDVPRPFARAPRQRAHELLSRYRDAGGASRQATTAVGQAAEAVHAPSRLLNTAREAVVGGRTGSSDHADMSTTQYDVRNDPEAPGPVERTLRTLGVTTPDVLRRGAEIDRVSERLIIDAAVRQDRERIPRDIRIRLNRSAGTAALASHALASGDPRAAALMRRPVVPQREPPEREP